MEDGGEGLRESAILTVRDLANAMELKIDSIESDPTYKYLAEHSKRGVPPPAIRFHPEKCVLSKFYLNHVDKIRNFEVRNDDVWIVTYPKCGTTWTQEMVWLMKNNYNYQESREVKTYCRIPFLEYRYLQNPDLPFNPIAEASRIEELNSRKSPRVIKSHLAMSLLPNQLWSVKPKIIFVYRNPKDVVTSYFHHYQLFSGYTGTKDEFIKAFLEEKVAYGSFWGNVLPFWKKRNEPHILFITFEDMKRDLKKVVHEIADFLGTAVPPEMESSLLDHLSFRSMSKNPAVNMAAPKSDDPEKKDLQFIRRGESGTWNKDLSPEQVQQFDEWSNAAIAGTGFPHYL